MKSQTTKNPAELDDGCKVKPLDIMLALEKDDVESRPIWKPMHLQPVTYSR